MPDEFFEILSKYLSFLDDFYSYKLL